MRVWHRTRVRRRIWVVRVRAKSSSLDASKSIERQARPIGQAVTRSPTRPRVDSLRSAMSCVTFYVNRAGRRLSESIRRELERAKDELRAVLRRSRGRRRS
jgi:hypothetical protein